MNPTPFNRFARCGQSLAGKRVVHFVRMCAAGNAVADIVVARDERFVSYMTISGEAGGDGCMVDFMAVQDDRSGRVLVDLQVKKLRKQGYTMEHEYDEAAQRRGAIWDGFAAAGSGGMEALA